MADIVCDATNVKQAAEAITVWVPLISAVVGGILAIAGGVVTQCIITRKEKKVLEKNLASERAFLGAGLILYLKECRFQLNQVATDHGDYLDKPGEELVRVPLRHAILPDISAIEGDWKVLPGPLLLQIRSIAFSQQGHERYLVNLHDLADGSPEYKEYFTERRERYRKLAGRCAALEDELRVLCALAK